MELYVLVDEDDVLMMIMVWINRILDYENHVHARTSGIFLLNKGLLNALRSCHTCTLFVHEDRQTGT